MPRSVLPAIPSVDLCEEVQQATQFFATDDNTTRHSCTGFVKLKPSPAGTVSQLRSHAIMKVMTVGTNLGMRAISKNNC